MEGAHVEAPRRRWCLPAWVRPLSLGLTLFLVYSANRSETIGADDTTPAQYLPLAVIRGDGLALDRFAPVLRDGNGTFPFCVTIARGRLVSRYPVAPALLAVPIEWPMIAALDRLRPGWDHDPARLRWNCMRMTKVAAALIVALAGVLLDRLLRQMGLRRVALVATLAAMLGSDLWAVGSQSLWQHGPVALAVLATLNLLHGESLSSRRLALAGLACGLIVAFRAIDVVLAAAITLGLAWQRPRALAWFLPGPVLVGTLLVGSNLWLFGALEGGQAQLEGLHSAMHGRTGAWSGHMLEGAAGTLVSPSRGLLVFSSWVVPALAMLPLSWPRLRRWPVAAGLVLALVPFLAIVSKYAVWWAGHCFGPRFWTETMPIFAIVLALGLDELRQRWWPALAMVLPTVILSVAIQVVGAFLYPSSWNDRPNDVDRHHERLWSWRDSELTRCLAEGSLDPTPRLRSLATRVFAARR